MKIKDAAHAVRVLESLVEQGEDFIIRLKIPEEAHWCMAVVEGAKTVLECLGPDPLSTDIHRIDFQEGQLNIAIGLAQAYAARMEEAGMKVPE